jgi:DNA mismatch endonuclease (patch repair protein)
MYAKDLPGRPDFVFRRRALVVFVDSEFWHMHPSRFQMPASNVRYWRRKLLRNKVRDREVNGLLRKRGYRVIRLWQRDVQLHVERCVVRIAEALAASAKKH